MNNTFRNEFNTLGTLTGRATYSRELAVKSKAAQQRANDAFAEILDYAKADGIGIVHINMQDYSQQGGITIAFAPANKYKSCRMVNVAVQSCSIDDTFNKRIGTRGALLKFYNDETIQLPLLDYYDKEDLAYLVKQAFTALYQAAH